MKAGANNPKILVTRPAIDQQQTQDALAALGFEAVASPVMDVVALPFALPCESWQGLVVTSRNALRLLSETDLMALLSVPLVCVGGRVEALARSLGFSTICACLPDVAHLTAWMLEKMTPQSGPILYLTGKHRSGDLAGCLEKRGFNVTLKETYEMVSCAKLTRAASDCIVSGELSGVLVYSKRTSLLLISLVERHHLGEQLKEVTFYCLSHGVASPLQKAGYRSVVAKEPNEKSLLACVKNRS